MPTTAAKSHFPDDTTPLDRHKISDTRLASNHSTD